MMLADFIRYGAMRTPYGHGSPILEFIRAETMMNNANPTISVDVAAYNDYVIHRLDHPRPLAEFRASLTDRVWAQSPDMTDDLWLGYHAAYVDHFERYQHDPKAIEYREQRKAREQRDRHAPQQRRRF